MKTETLVKRFATLGYTPKGLPRDEEVQSIMKWLYTEHNIFVSAQYIHLKFSNLPSSYLKFYGTYRYGCGQEFDQQFVTDRFFKNPYDAYFDALRTMLPAFKFRSQFTKKK